MCLGVPGKVLEIKRTEMGTLLGSVEFGGIRKQIGLDFVPEVQPGQYVIVHAGFAINVLDEAEADETLRLLREVAAAAAEEDRSATGEDDEVRG